MKNKFKSALLLLSLIGFAAKSKTVENTNGTIDPNDSKSKYINNQDYLSPSSLKDYKGFYGDSLKGFDEDFYRAIYLKNNLTSQELMLAMNRQKRYFIDTKYNIVRKANNVAVQPSVPQNQGSPNLKPIGGGNSINVLPCVNEDFEATPPGQYFTANAVTGWTVESGLNNSTVYSPNVQYGAGCVANPVNPAVGWTAGSPEFSIVATPVLGVPFIGNLPNSPLGGTNVARLQNTTISNGPVTRMSTSFPVTNANTLFQFAYAGSWDGAHECCGQPAFRVDMYQCSGPGSLTPIPLPCANVSLTPSGPNCVSGVPGYSMTGGVSWTNWVTKYIDLTPYIGQCIKMVVTVSDCSYSGHHGSAWFDARCGGQLVGSGLGGVGGSVPGSVSFCAGGNQAIINAPLGYASYQWIGPGNNVIPAPLGTAPTLTISGPVPGSVYTVQATSPSGCQYIITNTLNISTVNIAGIGSSSTCPGGASGSATVQGNGSGTGYNYNWLNTSSVTIGTASIVTGLAPGVYSVVITGFGAAGCGSAVTTVTINNGPPGIINVYKPFCNNEAYLFAGPGSNFKWYNNLTPIAPPAGVQPSYTVTSPVNGGIYWLSYLSAQGCQDSVKFTLGISPPGQMAVSNIKLVCPGGSNGTAVVSMTPAPGSPPGGNSFSVVSTGTTAPYTASLYPTGLNAFTPTGLSAGSYTVSTFDGSCKYGTTFNVQALTYTFAVTPVTSTLCPGNAVAAGITFSVPPSATQYSYLWSPATWLAGNTQQSTIISPSTPPGVITTIIYTVVVTPTIANCPTSHTISVTAANPVIPVMSAVPNLCDVSTPFNIVATPGGGTFTAANANLINPSTGVLSPSFAPSFGVQTYTYSYNVFQCVASNTANFEVSQFHTTALTGTVPNLCVTNSPVNLMNIVQSTVNGTWSGIGWSLGNNNTFNPAPLPTGIYPIQYATFSNPNPTVCPSTTTMNVSVTKTLTPYITPKLPFCNHEAAFTLTVNMPGGGWTGNGITNSGVVTPSLYTNPGNYVATYTVNDGPCLNSNTTILPVNIFVSADLTGPVPYLCSSFNPFNLLSITQNTTGTWGGMGAIVNNVLNPVGVPTNTYLISYTTTSYPSPICIDVSSTVVNLLNPAAANITQVGPFCNNGSPVQLTVSPNTGSWTPSPYLSSTGVFSPSLCPVGNNLVQYIVGTNTCNTTQTKQISIEAFVTAALSGAVPNLCNTNSPYNLQNTTQNNLGTWSGIGIQGQSFNPSTSGAGNFVLTYNTVSSPSGLCPDQSTVAVTVYSLATPYVTKIGPFCNSEAPKQINVVPLGGLFGGANNIAVTPEGLFNPPSAVIGDNIINYSITAGPCVAYGQTTISIEAFVSADFSKAVGPYCRNNQPVNLNGFVVNPGGMWAGTGMQGSMFNPAMANIGSNNTVTYSTHSMPTASLCPDFSEVRISVNQMPQVTIASNLKKGCSPLEVVLNVNNTNTGSGLWNLGDGSDPKTGLTTSYVYSHPGTYTVMLSYEDEIGCKGQAKLEGDITVYDAPIADFSAPAEVLISNPDVQFTNLSTVLGDNKYTWKVGSLYQSNDVHYKVKFDKIGRYPVTLQAISIHDCKNEITKTIEVKNDFNIYIPSSFTPNFDGLNDVFIPVFSEYGLDPKTYEMEVFDRWGHSLFYTKDVTKGWDGTVSNKGSEDLKEEVFIYKLKYKDLDGNVYNKMGHVTLLK